MEKSFYRIKGALYGVAVGEALGGGGGEATQTTLAVASGIAENPADPVPGIGKRLIEWAAGNPKNIGWASKAAITAAEEFGADTAAKWKSASHIVHLVSGGRTGGDGALMRTVYTGLFYNGLEDVLEKTAAIAEMTHYGKASTALCQKYAEMVFRCAAGDEHALRDRIDERLGNHGGRDAMHLAIRSIDEAEGFEDAVARAVNLGGGSAAIGAVTGGLAGAVYGFGEIPEAWVGKLDPAVRDRLDELSEAAHASVYGKE